MRSLPLPPVSRPPRLAAGRARALGLPTRGTTNPNRLRRMDNWVAGTLGGWLRAQEDALVVDLGFGASPVTTVELSARLPGVRVLGLEIDPVRVDAATPAADPPRLSFARGGFELAGTRPTLVRAANVLRQYDEPAALAAWRVLQRSIDPAGRIIDGTCDEVGRRACWVLLDRQRPLTLTLACRVSAIDRPGELAERLPKALIHHNVPSQPVHALLADLDLAWNAAAPLAPFGARQRWIAACTRVAAQWPVRHRSRFRYGELTVDWDAVAPS